jgi:hypothetical protein
MAERIVDAVQLLKSVFQEIPGTQLSVAQASRLTGMDPWLCESVVSALEQARVLKRTRDGRHLYWIGERTQSASDASKPNGGLRS